ncbi:MAG TPA: hypothetical protein ENO09_05910, partial [bacterium]|nr:hypothetical protein [bacterium]
MTWQTIELPTGLLEVREDPHNTRSLASLCHFGARNNPKRGFLFVSTVLGKHLPTQPARMLDVHQQLAGRIEATQGAPTLFIGMAETGIGFSYGVFDAWKHAHPNDEALFIHSTRYPLDGLSLVNFEESHCHAPNQYLHLPEQRDLLQRAQTLVMLDDEVSTGKTFNSLWHALRTHCPNVERIAIVTLTDFMDDNAHATLDQNLALPTQHIHAARAQWRFIPKAWQAPPSQPSTSVQPPTARTPNAHLGRAGISQPITLPESLLEQIQQLLHAHPADALIRIIGTGEFMHAPYLVALHLEQQGRRVTYQSSTRSPILEFGPIQHTQLLLDPYGLGDPYFIYNAAAHSPTENSVTFILH